MAKTLEIDVDVDTGAAITDVDKLVKSIEGLTDEMKTAKEETDGIGDGLKEAGEKGEKGLKKVGKGFKGVGIAIKAAGIGLVIAAFAALKEILEKQQPVLDLVDSAFTAIGLAISQVSKSLKSSGTEFSALGTIMGNILTLTMTPLKAAFFGIKGGVLAAQLAWEESFFGGQDEDKIAELKMSLKEVGEDLIEIKDSAVDASLSIKDNFVEAVGEIGHAASAIVEAVDELDANALISQAKRTTALKNEALIREAINRGIFEQYDREAELLRQQRDDTTLTIEERKKANTELGEVLKEQEIIMLRNAAVVEAAAQAEFNANTTTENRVALIEAQNEQEAIRADITGRRSEQIINEIGLEQEQADALALEKKTRLENDKKDLDKAAADNKLRGEKEVANAKIVEETKAKLRDINLNSAMSGVKLLASLDEENKGLQAAAIIAENAVGITKMVISNNVANAGALATPQAILTAGVSAVPTIIANNISTGISVASSIAATAKGLAGLKKGGSAGSKPSLPTPNGGGSASAPSINEETLFSSQNLDGAESDKVDSNRGLNQLRAVVVESDITTVQKNINNIESRSEIG
jgi:hypothetical protein